MSVMKRMFAAVCLMIVFVVGSAPTANADTTLIATNSNEAWLLHNDGTLPPGNWYAATYTNDADWAGGLAPMGYGDALTYGTTLSFGGDANNKWTSYYFRKHITIPDPSAVTGLVVSCWIDDGAVFYVNGTRVHATLNMRDPIGNSTFSVYNGDLNNGPSTFTIDPSLLMAGDNVIAVELHQGNLTSSDVLFDMSLTAVSYATTNQPGGYPTNWTALHDCAWTDGDAVTNASLIFTTNSPVALAANTLITTAGQPLPITQLTFGSNAPLDFAVFGATPELVPGTDAATEFAGMIGTNNRCGWSSGTLTMTLTGLDSNKQYKTVLWVTRGATGGVPPYVERLTDVTLSGADTFMNTSSTGMNTTIFQTTVANDSTRMQADSAYGYVVRFEQVRPGTDGTIVFSLSANGSLGQSNAYINALKVVESNVSMAAPGDNDADGMDDVWESTYFGSTSALNGGTNEDYDSDGSSNYDEYIAGTLPNSASSKLAITSTMTNAPGSVVFSWSGVAGKTYTVQGATTVTSTWTTLQSGIPGVSPTTVYTGSTATARNFMRVKVQ